MPGDLDVLNARAAAAFLGTHVETVRRLARRGGLPCFKVGKDWRFRKEALVRWADGQQTGRSPAASFSALIVDDEPRICQSLAKMIAGFGGSSRQATSGARALELVAEQVPDIIVLDLKMPGMTGPELLARLRPEHTSLPVVVVTGFPDSELVTQAMQHAPIMMLAKPVDRELFKRTVLSVVGRRSAIEQERISADGRGR